MSVALTSQALQWSLCILPSILQHYSLCAFGPLPNLISFIHQLNLSMEPLSRGFSVSLFHPELQSSSSHHFLSYPWTFPNPTILLVSGFPPLFHFLLSYSFIPLMHVPLSDQPCSCMGLTSVKKVGGGVEWCSLTFFFSEMKLEQSY